MRRGSALSLVSRALCRGAPRLVGMRRAASPDHRPARDRAGARRAGFQSDAGPDGPRPAAALCTGGRTRRVRAARHIGPAAEPGRLVLLHHGSRPGRPRDLRLHPPRPEDDDAVPVDDQDRAAPPFCLPGQVATPADRRTGGTAQKGPRLLGPARSARHRHDDRAHACQLPAFRERHTGTERDGHARSARHVRDVLVLHVGSARDGRRRRGGDHLSCPGP